MSLEFKSLTEILDQIGSELTNQISLAKNMVQTIDTRKLFQQSDILNSRIRASKLSEEDKLMLQKFSSTLVQDNTTVKNLRYEKRDLERVISNLNN